MVKYYEIEMGLHKIAGEKIVFFTSNKINSLEQAIKLFDIIYPQIVNKRVTLNLVGKDENNIGVMNATILTTSGLVLQQNTSNWECQTMHSWETIIERRSEWEG